MKRKIELEISSCNECPYLEYDSHYSRSYDSGYDCNFKEKDRRIKNDNDHTIDLENIHSSCELPTILSSTLKKL